MNIGLLLLRLVVGLTFAAHGTQKLFGWFGGGGLDGTARGMEHLGFAQGRRSALLAGLAETGGGLLLALGAATPAAAAVLIATMLVATFAVHIEHGFFTTQGGYELPLALATVALSLVFTGPGRWSVDSLLGLHLSGPGWALAALIAGLVGGTIQLASRRTVAAHTQHPQASA